MRLPALLIFSVISYLFTGCAQNVPLKPAPAAETKKLPSGAIAAVEAVDGVRVAVIPRAWPGNVEISEAVTPVKVRIENNSRNRVLVRYSNIRLIGSRGKSYAALPPHSIEATVSEPRLAPGYGPVTMPGFAGTGFGVAPLYSPLYPGLPAAPGGFFYDPWYYNYYGDYWRTIALPTPAMVQRALPEGSLNAGGSVEGFLYFQKVGNDVSRVRFLMDVVSADKGGVIGTIEIPLVVTQ